MQGLVNASKSGGEPFAELQKTLYKALITNPDPNPELRPSGYDEDITFEIYPHPEERAADGVVVFHPGGAQVKAVEKFAVHNPPPSEAGRKIAGRSDKAKSRLMRHLIQVDMGAVASERKGARYARCVFVTLTYPWIEFPTGKRPFTDWGCAKDHTKALRKRIEAKHGLKWAVWVQEHQESGALHFHLVILLSRVVNVGAFRAWLAKAWYEVVGSENPDHLKVGTSADAVYIEQGEPGNLLGYLSKELGGFGKRYQIIAFDCETGEVLETGKTWGIWGRDLFNAAKVIVVKLRIVGREAWQKFKENVAVCFEKSPYLRTVADMVWWGGGLLYGDGCELINKLLEGVPDGAWEFV